MSSTLKLYISGVVLAAVSSTVMLPAAGLADAAGAATVLGLLAVVAGARSVRIPRLGVQVTPGDAFIFCSLVAVNPLAAPVLALITTLGASFGPNRRPLSFRTIFNLGAVTLSASAAAWCFVLLGGNAATGSSRVLGPMLAAAGVFFFTNTLLVALAIRLRSRGGFLAIWRQSGLWTAVSTLTSYLLAAGLLYFLAAVGPLALVIGLSGTAVLAGSYRAYRHAIETGDRACDIVLRELNATIDAHTTPHPETLDAPASVAGLEPPEPPEPSSARPPG